MDKLKDIESNFNPKEWFEGWHLNTDDIEWMIAEIERLRIVEQAYQALLSATAGQQK